MNCYDSAHGVVGPLKALLREFSGLDQCTMSNLYDDIIELGKRYVYRGIGVALTDLPKLGKLFDASLNSQEIPEKDDVPRSLHKKGGFLFEDLFDIVYPRSARVEPRNIRVARTMLFLFKKVRLDAPQVTVIRSHHDFFDLDATLRRPTLQWNSESLDEFWSCSELSPSFCAVPTHDRVLDKLLYLLDTAAFLIVPSDEVSTDDLLGRHGPGRVSDLPPGADKFTFPSWSMRLSERFPPSWLATSWGESEMHINEAKGVTPHAKLIAVRKTYDKPRLIASEPTSQQWCQQSLLRWLRDHQSDVSRLMINFRDQEPSRRAALDGSLHDDLATVDLESASDRLTCWTVERFFRCNKSLLEHLWSSRTSHVSSSLVDRSTELQKFAAQGSAVTFPVQSLVYAGCALAATIYAYFGSLERFQDECRRSMRRFTNRSIYDARVIEDAFSRTGAPIPRIFGDDIIIAKDALIYLGLIFDHLGLKINRTKTFYHGPFRESCGMDAYHGEEVTPVYFSNMIQGTLSLRDCASWVSVRNNAYIAGFRSLAGWMTSVIPDEYRDLIPEVDTRNRSFAGVSLLYDGLGDRVECIKKRYNKKLHRFETRSITVLPCVRVKEREGWANLIQYFTESYDIPTSLVGGSYELIRNGKLGFVDQQRIRLLIRWVPC